QPTPLRPADQWRREGWGDTGETVRFPPWFSWLLRSRRELEDRRRVQLLPRPKDRGREVRVVGRVREVLRLQREPVALAVRVAARPVDRPVEEVARVELDPRLRGQEVEVAVRRGVVYVRRLDE